MRFLKEREGRLVALFFGLPLFTACGGADDAMAPASVEFAEGLYSTTYLDRSPAELGQLLQRRDRTYVFSSPHGVVGYGAWSSISGHYTTTMTAIPRVLDDLANEFPIAKGVATSRNLQVTLSSGTTFSGPSLVTSATTIESVPTISALAGQWRFRNIYRFAGKFLDYALTLSIASNGSISGSDTNDCKFYGTLAPAAGNLYEVTITAYDCGQTLLYIENYEYRGLATLVTNLGTEKPWLSIVAVNEARALGLAFMVHAQ